MLDEGIRIAVTLQEEARRCASQAKQVHIAAGNSRKGNSQWMKNNVAFTGEVWLGHLRYGTHGENSIENVRDWVNRGKDGKVATSIEATNEKKIERGEKTKKNRFVGQKIHGKGRKES